ncbi:hypothetical protein C8F04DRAFT_1235653 [Mycena alexandri]|uniref:Uncharacterized protein n=1 Tax=Mycena alexandri TaxID=1745969 RepID=A0AAD6SQ25_9AGAR|nr:hypothetical protein C8F04DRAFT_1235653 [Mycena alexandri]
MPPQTDTQLEKPLFLPRYKPHLFQKPPRHLVAWERYKRRNIKLAEKLVQELSRKLDAKKDKLAELGRRLDKLEQRRAKACFWWSMIVALIGMFYWPRSELEAKTDDLAELERRLDALEQRHAKASLWWSMIVAFIGASTISMVAIAS